MDDPTSIQYLLRGDGEEQEWRNGPNWIKGENSSFDSSNDGTEINWITYPRMTKPAVPSGPAKIKDEVMSFPNQNIPEELLEDPGMDSTPAIQSSDSDVHHEDEDSDDDSSDPRKRKLNIIQESTVRDVIIPPHRRRMMEKFSKLEGNTWKHVLYNLLVDNHNNPELDSLIWPCQISHEGVLRDGFRFDAGQKPKRQLAELYAAHIRNVDLTTLTYDDPGTQKIYGKYSRAALQLVSKYFPRAHTDWTYVYHHAPLFIPNEELRDATARLKKIAPRSSKNANKKEA